jgi:signal transduction histidine kinase
VCSSDLVSSTNSTPARGELELPTPGGARRFEYLVTALGDDGSLVVSLRDLTAGAVRPANDEDALAGPAAPAPGPDADSEELATRLRQSCHDLRTRLTVILNWGLILGRQELREGMVQQGAAAVVQSARRMGELVDALAAVADEQDPGYGRSGPGSRG